MSNSYQKPPTYLPTLNSVPWLSLLRPRILSLTALSFLVLTTNPYDLQKHSTEIRKNSTAPSWASQKILECWQV